MATESEKKIKSEEIPIAIDKLSVNYCDDCWITWCSIRDKVVYCSFKYKGEAGFVCSDDKCINDGQ
ncbi:MAG: hypothetical protein FK734_12715 [Asgard group archaeon]|nr:hypothetical protein [Asgard group archaeon]